MKITREIIDKDIKRAIEMSRLMWNKAFGKDKTKCLECGDVYKKGEDLRVDAGMKCSKCTYQNEI